MREDDKQFICDLLEDLIYYLDSESPSESLKYKVEQAIELIKEN